MIASQYLIVAAVGIACVSGGVGYVKGKSDESDRHAQFRAEVAATNAKLQAENAAQLRAAEQATSDIATQYEVAAAGLAGNYNSRLERLRRESASHCATLSLVAGAAAQPDAATADTRPDPGTFEATCQRLESDCARTTLTTIFLQDWVRRVCR